MSSKVTDKDLRLQQLKLTNAYEQPGLILRPIEPTDRLLGLLNIYRHEHYPREKVYCSQCNGHHHGKGFTALVLTGSGATVRLLFGSKCGAESFEDWHLAARTISRQEDRQWELGRLDCFARVAGELKATLIEWKQNLPAMVGRKSAFVVQLSDLAARCEEAWHYNGQLFVHRQLTLKNGQRHVDTQFLGPLPGAKLWHPLNLTTTVERTLAAIAKMQEFVGRTDGVFTRDLKARRRAFEECFEDLQTVFDMYEAGQEFFTVATFTKLVEWTRKHAVTSKRYSWDGNAIIDRDGAGELQVPKPFREISSVPLDLIAEYKRGD